MNEVSKRKVEERIQERKRNLPDFAIEFLESLEFDRSIQTQLEYTKDIKLFVEYLVECDVIEKKSTRLITLEEMKSVTEGDIRNFINYLTNYKKEFISTGGNITIQEFSNGPRGKERKRVSVHSLFAYFVERNRLDKNPVDKIRIKINKYTIKPRLADRELNKMFDIALNDNPDAFRGLRNYTMLRVLAFTGIRISELTNLNVEDIWQSRNEFIITRKGGEQESIYINENIREEFYNYLNERKKIENIQKGHKSALFLSQQMRRLDPRSVRKMMRKVAAEAGVDVHVTPHTFRRTFGWKHYNEFHDLELTAELLGHSSTDTTRQNYANADRERSNRSLDTLKYDSIQ